MNMRSRQWLRFGTLLYETATPDERSSLLGSLCSVESPRASVTLQKARSVVGPPPAVASVFLTFSAEQRQQQWRQQWRQQPHGQTVGVSGDVFTRGEDKAGVWGTGPGRQVAQGQWGRAGGRGRHLPPPRGAGNGYVGRRRHGRVDCGSTRLQPCLIRRTCQLPEAPCGIRLHLAARRRFIEQGRYIRGPQMNSGLNIVVILISPHPQGCGECLGERDRKARSVGCT